MTKHDKPKEDEEIIAEPEAVGEIDGSAQQIEALEKKAEESEDKYKRALADYQNLQKRSIEERMQWIRSANRDLLLRILTVLDTLLLANQHVQDKNLEVSINHFLDILKSEGVMRIETIGHDFDPEVMEAITTAEGEEGKVIAEVRAGFMLYDKLLRAAQVTVGKGE